MRPTSSHLLPCLFLLSSFGLMRPAHADITVAARQLDLPGVHLQDMKARIGEDPAGGLHLQMQAAQADVAALGWHHVGLRLDGRLQRDTQRRWSFDGRVQLRGAPGGALTDAQLGWVVTPDADTLRIDLQQDKAQANAWLPLDQPSHVQINLRQWPVAWLQGLLGRVWAGRLTAGRLDADLALDAQDATVQSSGQFELDGAAFEKTGGLLAGQGLSGNGRFDFDDEDAAGTTLVVQGQLDGGELQLGPLYAKLPNHPVQLAVSARVQQGAVELQRLRIDDADALRLDGSLAFDARGKLRTLQLARFRANFPQAYQRYGHAWLATLGWRDLVTAGRLDGSIDWSSDGLDSFAFDAAGLDLADAGGSLAVSGLHGGLDWSAHGDRPATTLGWQSLQFHRVTMAAATSHWQDRGGRLSLLQPFAVPLLNGELRMNSLAWQPAAAQDQRLAGNLALAGIDMASLSHALAWPTIPGTLAGTFPTVRWAAGGLELDGSLAANVFGGRVDAPRLSLQQPLGGAPELTGDFKLTQLDLAAVTSVFDFGNMTGPLHGSVDGLHLVGWRPVAFKAVLLADSGGRISQRAVGNLNALGNGGAVGGLQGVMLKLFKNFGYKRIGLSCVLQDEVCQMGGLAADDSGYTILEGSGLPHLQVVGHQAKIDWSTLQRRLREAAGAHATTAH
ncbi:MAG: hypothetical protein RSP_15110 [Rhodanobacter sp.]